MYSRGSLGFLDYTDEEKELFKPVRQRLVRTHPVHGPQVALSLLARRRHPRHADAGSAHPAARPQRARHPAALRLRAQVEAQRPRHVGQPPDHAPRPPLRRDASRATCAAPPLRAMHRPWRRRRSSREVIGLAPAGGGCRPAGKPVGHPGDGLVGSVAADVGVRHAGIFGELRHGVPWRQRCDTNRRVIDGYTVVSVVPCATNTGARRAGSARRIAIHDRAPSRHFRRISFQKSGRQTARHPGRSAGTRGWSGCSRRPPSLPLAACPARPCRPAAD